MRTALSTMEFGLCCRDGERVPNRHRPGAARVEASADPHSRCSSAELRSSACPRARTRGEARSREGGCSPRRRSGSSGCCNRNSVSYPIAPGSLCGHSLFEYPSRAVRRPVSRLLTRSHAIGVPENVRPHVGALAREVVPHDRERRFVERGSPDIERVVIAPGYDRLRAADRSPSQGVRMKIVGMAEIEDVVRQKLMRGRGRHVSPADRVHRRLLYETQARNLCRIGARARRSRPRRFCAEFRRESFAH